MTTPFDFVNSISYNKNDILNDETESAYIPFIVNRALSQYFDTVLYANEINKYSQYLTKREQYDFYLQSIRPKRRFAKWPKRIKNDQLELIAKYYKCNLEQAKIASTLLTKEQKDYIEDYFKINE